MSFLMMSLIAALAAPTPPARVWDTAGCARARSEAPSRTGHVCAAAHLDADYKRLLADLKDPLNDETEGFVRWLVERGGVETGAAASSLGDLYYNGQGLPRDAAQAASWYRRAAEQGLAGAQFNLGLMHSSGIGVPQDYVEAYKWLNLATARATQDTQGIYAAARELLMRSMTPGQIAAAQILSREWSTAFAARGRRR